MPVRGIHDQHVDSRLHQLCDSLFGVATGADRGAGKQPSMDILARDREVLCLLDILHGNHAGELEGLVDDQHLFDAVLM